MRKVALIAELLIMGLILSGCAGWAVREPNAITFENAMRQVANGLNEMYDIGKDHPKSGLVPSEVTIEFNISATGKDADRLYIEAGIPAVNIAKAGAEASSEKQASRGNKITIKFVNLFLSDANNTLLMKKSPEEIVKIIKALKDINVEIYKVK